MGPKEPKGVSPVGTQQPSKAVWQAFQILGHHQTVQQPQQRLDTHLQKHQLVMW